MAMGIVSDSELESEIRPFNSPTPSIPSRSIPSHSIPSHSIPIPSVPVAIKPIPTPGRNEGDKNAPESLRKLIGETAAIEGHSVGVELAQSFGLSSSSVSAYAHGAKSTASYNKPDEDLKNHISAGRDRVANRARIKLMKALSYITDDKLENAKLAEVSGVARDMSAIMRNMTEKNEELNNPAAKNMPVFVFYKPEVAVEENYKTIHIRE